MKKCFLFFCLCLAAPALFAQVSPASVSTDVFVGSTEYDMQTNKSCQNRIYRYSDGTIGATWMYSQQAPNWNDRGTGYNYFNGTSWLSQPTARIESIKAGWPSYAPFGTGGEVVVSHKGGTSSLMLLKRTTKGTGAWSQVDIPSPSGSPGMTWPRMVTNGPNHTYIHIIALTTPTGNGGTTYMGLDGALLYNRSLDGGVTWLGWQQLPGMSSSQYLKFQGDTYAWAEPRGDTLCFAEGDAWNDAFIMKSTNNGVSWTKTVVWSCPYNLWNGTTSVPLHNCPDGSMAVALDNQGKAHVVFGKQRALGEDTGITYWYPFTDGVIYWNENQAQLPQSLDSSLLVSSGNLIGLVQDPAIWLAGSTELPYYGPVSMTSMPTITIDSYNHIFVVWSGVTNYRDPNNFMLRHLFSRASVNDGLSWCPDIVDLNSGILYIDQECVYPSLSPTSNDNIYILYQTDDYGGSYVKSQSNYQGQDFPDINDIQCLITPKSAIQCAALPQVDFVAGNVNPAPNQTVVFTDLSANIPTSWQWSFSPNSVVYVDATSAASQNPHVQFLGVGYYSVTLVATNSYGSGSLTKTNYIHAAYAPPVADFTANQTNITIGGQVLFTDLSTGSPTSWQWTFTGGTPSSSSLHTPPPVTYSAAGQYDVILTVTNGAGSNTNTKVHYITVTNPAIPPVADFTASQTSILTGGQVQFADLSTNGPTSWQWSFPGGSPASSSLQTPPPVTYSAPGQYDVTLTVTNAAGSSTNTKVHYITVTNPTSPPIANFMANPTNIPAGSQVQFTDLSTNGPTSWQWSFPGGTPSSSTLQSPPQVTYSIAGQYDVSLTVTNLAGSSTNTKSQYIVVSAPGAPVANFVADHTNIGVGGQVQFYDLSTGNPVSWQWSFSGGYPASYFQQTPPPVTYYVQGQYDVMLTVTNGGGSSTNTRVKYINVGNSGIGETGSVSTLLYPNPASSYIRVRSNSPVREMTLRDQVGKTVLQVSPGAGDFGIGLENILPGMYIAQLQTALGTVYRKIVVSR